VAIHLGAMSAWMSRRRNPVVLNYSICGHRGSTGNRSYHRPSLFQESDSGVSVNLTLPARIWLFSFLAGFPERAWRHCAFRNGQNFLDGITKTLERFRPFDHFGVGFILSHHVLTSGDRPREAASLATLSRISAIIEAMRTRFGEPFAQCHRRQSPR
jgi:hypothetical protein